MVQHRHCIMDKFNRIEFKLHTCTYKCLAPIPLSTIYTIYSKNLWEVMDSTETIDPVKWKLDELKEKMASPVDCYDCGKWILPEDVDENAEVAWCNPNWGGCGKHMCVLCCAEAHALETPVRVVKNTLYGGREVSRRWWGPCEKVDQRKKAEIRLRRARRGMKLQKELRKQQMLQLKSEDIVI